MVVPVLLVKIMFFAFLHILDGDNLGRWGCSGVVFLWYGIMGRRNFDPVIATGIIDLLHSTPQNNYVFAISKN